MMASVEVGCEYAATFMLLTLICVAKATSLTVLCDGLISYHTLLADLTKTKVSLIRKYRLYSMPLMFKVAYVGLLTSRY